MIAKINLQLHVELPMVLEQRTRIVDTHLLVVWPFLKWCHRHLERGLTWHFALLFAMASAKRSSLDGF